MNIPAFSIVGIASANPIKRSAVEEVFKRAFTTTLEFVSISNTDQDLSKEPIGRAEIEKCVRTRIDRAQAMIPHAFFWVAIESGVTIQSADAQDPIVYVENLLFVRCLNGEEYEAWTPCFLLPRCLAAPVLNGIELGKAADNVFGVQESKQHEENNVLTRLSNGLVTRRTHYVHTLSVVLMPLISKEIYAQRPTEAHMA